jgi:hypothetical protein
LISGLAHAQPERTDEAATEPASRFERAGMLFNQARTAQQAQRWGEARELYSKLWEERTSHDVAANLGQIELRLGLYREAAEHLTFAAHRLPADSPEGAEAAVRHLLSLARQQVVTIDLRTDPHATITVEGESLPAWLPTGTFYVEPGRHEVVVTRVGFEPFRTTISGQKGDVVVIDASLRPKRAPPASEQKTLDPPSSQSAPDVEHRVGRSTLHGPLAATLFVGGGVAVAGLGAGWVFSRAADRSDVSLDTVERLFAAKHTGTSPCGEARNAADCAALDRTRGERTRHRTAATWSYAVGVSAGLGTGAYLLFVSANDSSASPSSPSVAPLVIAAGLAAAGTIAGTAFLFAAETSERDAARIRADLDRQTATPTSSCTEGMPFIPECAELLATVSDAMTSRELAAVAFSVAAVEALGAVAYWFWPRADQAEVQVTALVTDREAMAGFWGTF